MGRRQLGIYHGFCSGMKSTGMYNVELSLHARGTASPIIFETSILFCSDWQKERIDNSLQFETWSNQFCSQATSKLEEHGDVAQTVERLLRMREVRGSMPRISKHFWGFDNSTLFWLTGKNWQLGTDRKLIYHGFCSEASSKLEKYGNVAEMVERSLCMREVSGSMPRISKTFSGFENSMCLLIMGRNWQLVTNRKLISWILFRS